MMRDGWMKFVRKIVEMMNEIIINGLNIGGKCRYCPFIAKSYHKHRITTISDTNINCHLQVVLDTAVLFHVFIPVCI